MYFPETTKALKEEYRRHAMALHPDRGGSTSAFQQMSKQYEAIMRLLQESANIPPKEASAAPKSTDFEVVPFELRHFNLRELHVGYATHMEGEMIFELPVKAAGQSVELKIKGKIVKRLYLQPYVRRLRAEPKVAYGSKDEDKVHIMLYCADTSIYFGYATKTVAQLKEGAPLYKGEISSKDLDPMKWEIASTFIRPQFEGFISGMISKSYRKVVKLFSK